jgi:hypothetical protein
LSSASNSGLDPELDLDLLDEEALEEAADSLLDWSRLLDYGAYAQVNPGALARSSS